MTPAAIADSLVFELPHLGVAAAEGAGVGHLADDDGSSLDRNEEMVPFADVEQLSRLGRYHDSAEIVDLSGDTTVHVLSPPWSPRLDLTWSRLPHETGSYGLG